MQPTLPPRRTPSPHTRGGERRRGKVYERLAHKNSDTPVTRIAGGKEKYVFMVNELDFDVCIDYKNESACKCLKQHCLKGRRQCVPFDNVGGEILDDVLTRINMKACIVICGAIEQYNTITPTKESANYLSPLANRTRMGDMAMFGRNAQVDAGRFVQDGRRHLRGI